MSWLGWVAIFFVVAFAARFCPAFIFQSFDDFFAVHKAYYTHLYTTLKSVQNTVRNKPHHLCLTFDTVRFVYRIKTCALVL